MHGPKVEEWKNDSGRHIRLLRARLPNGSVVGIRFDITDLHETQEVPERQNAALKEARETLFRLVNVDLVNVDELTGLTNRRAASAKLRGLIEKCQHDDRMMCWNLDGLQGMGFELQIDDYGTAHSSISGLLLIRPQRLKIDKQFALNVLTDTQSHKIVQLTVALAHELNIRVTAERVETAEQAKILKDLQCNRLQGFLFARPRPAHLSDVSAAVAHPAGHDDNDPDYFRGPAADFHVGRRR